MFRRVAYKMDDPTGFGLLRRLFGQALLPAANRRCACADDRRLLARAAVTLCMSPARFIFIITWSHAVAWQHTAERHEGITGHCRWRRHLFQLLVLILGLRCRLRCLAVIALWHFRGMRKPPAAPRLRADRCKPTCALATRWHGHRPGGWLGFTFSCYLSPRMARLCSRRGRLAGRGLAAASGTRLPGWSVAGTIALRRRHALHL